MTVAESWKRRGLAAWLVLEAVACSSGGAPHDSSASSAISQAPTAPPAGSNGNGIGDGKDESVQAEGCAAKPLALLLNVDGDDPRVLARLLDDGSVTMTSFGGAGDVKLGTLEPSGCLLASSGPDPVLIEKTPGGDLWTLRSVLRVEDGAIVLPASRLRVGADGVVLDETNQPTQFRFEGYEPPSTCAAEILLAVFFSSMPSMAVSDGNPAVMDPPEPSSCPERHAK